MPAGLGIDFGTSHTVAVVRRTDGRTESLLFDSSPLLPSAVFTDADGDVLVGRDALHSARTAPACMEPHPKHRIDDGTVLLGDREWAVADLFAAVLNRVRRECIQVMGQIPPQVVVTHPAVWGQTRRSVLLEACERAGFGDVRLLPEPVAAATYFVERLDHQVPAGASIVVYDFGGGTFDVSVVARDSTGFTVTALDGIDDLGGTDIDAAITAHLRGRIGEHHDWDWLDSPATTAQRRGRHGFIEDVRLAKERLARHTAADIYIPVLERDIHLTRPELEELAGPLVARSVRTTHAVIAEAGVTPGDLAGLFLVGGACRMPLVATMLHREFGTAPIVVDQLEQVVAQGALLASGDTQASSGAVPPPLTAGAAGGRPEPAAALPPAAGEYTATPVAVHTGRPDSTGAAESPAADTPRPRRTRRAVLAGSLGALIITAIPVAVALSGDEAPADPSEPPSSPPEPSWTPEVFADGLTDVGAVAFSPDGDTVAIAVEGAVELWTISGDSPVTLSHDGQCEQLSFSQDGERLAACGSGSAYVWEIASSEMTCEFHNDVGAVAISPDGSLLAYDDEGQIAIWDIGRAEVVHAVELGDEAFSLGFSPDATLLAVGWRGEPIVDFDYEHQVKVWNTADWEEVAVLDYSAAAVGPVAFSPDGSLLAVGGGSGFGTKIDLWSVDGWERTSLDADGDSANLAYSPDTAMLAAGGNTDGATDTDDIWLWDTQTHEHVDTLSHEDGPVRGVDYSPDGTMIAAALNSSVVMWQRPDTT